MRTAWRRRGMTAIEVLASTILSALLMTALIGILRGLKAQERTLESRRPQPAWQQSLEAALANDLQQATTYQLTPYALTLAGHGGRDESGRSNWLPSRVVYEVRKAEGCEALVRREIPAEGGKLIAPDNVALVGVADMRLGLLAQTDQSSPDVRGIIETAPTWLPPAASDTPLPPAMTIEFRNSQGETIFHYHHHRL